MKYIRNKQHDWDGCKCRKCDKIRNEQHDWAFIEQVQINCEEPIWLCYGGYPSFMIVIVTTVFKNL